MNAAIVSIIVAGVGVLGVLGGATIQAISGRGGRRAEMTDKITASYDRRLDRMDRDYAKLEGQCTKCQDELAAMRKVVRTVVRAMDANDPTAIETAISAARELL
ncbi:hypothetical protein A5733_17855 [Mycobacterium sp. NS-7484]|uniref:hypothetical protein n=1 Tax=Mycobacterium sp. NS-7484 TaxID=1834161 RepID=UPI00096D450F|nr:hypothetical protein [Mycobacterium sp. NS-7484]OMC06219.1 hypothetical protein A5733_17855 [Mycobacterium sp. NS-7484]